MISLKETRERAIKDATAFSSRYFYDGEVGKEFLSKEEALGELNENLGTSTERVFLLLDYFIQGKLNEAELESLIYLIFFRKEVLGVLFSEVSEKEEIGLEKEARDYFSALKIGAASLSELFLIKAENETILGKEINLTSELFIKKRSSKRR